MPNGHGLVSGLISLYKIDKPDYIFKFKFKNYFNRMFWRRSSETNQLLLSVSLRIQLFLHPVDRDVDRWR